MRTRRWTLLTLSLAAVLILGAYAVTAKTTPSGKVRENLTGAATLPQTGDTTVTDPQAGVCGPRGADSTEVAPSPFLEPAGSCNHHCHDASDCPKMHPIGYSWVCVVNCCVLEPD